MTKIVFIIGTTHKYQRNEKSRSEQKCFADMLRQNANKLSINGIAEEFSRGALAGYKLKTSSVEDLASRLGLPHRYCDPDMETRNALKIYQRNRIEMIALSEDEEISEAELDKREKKHLVKREHYWVRELIEFNTWPVLFVCGANHAESFQSVLAEYELTGEILELDWSA